MFRPFQARLHCRNEKNIEGKIGVADDTLKDNDIDRVSTIKIRILICELSFTKLEEVETAGSIILAFVNGSFG